MADKMFYMCCSTLDEMETAIQQYEDEKTVHYVKQKQRKIVPDMTRLDSLDGQCVRFESHKSKDFPADFDGNPFVVVGYEVRECQHGPNRHIAGAPTRRNRNRCLQLLRSEFCDTTEQQFKYQIQITEEHKNHLQGKYAGLINRLDKSIISQIKNTVEEGIVNVESVKRRINDTNIKNSRTDSTDHRYHPSHKDIYNHIYKAVADSRYGADDQQNVLRMVTQWKLEYQEDNFHFRPMTENYPLMFVHQTTFQQQLLTRYGHEICILDATYNTTKYQLPLFFLSVSTNVGYQVVGSFVLGKETTTGIFDALSLCSWNPLWKPTHFMCDFDQREISALEKLHRPTEIEVILCDFHKEQAWQRWLSAKKNNMSGMKEETLQILRQISRSDSKEEYEHGVRVLRIPMPIRSDPSETGWKNVGYSNTRKDMINVKVNTTNGLERIHRIFKEDFLKKMGFGGTLVSMLTVLVKNFCPESEKKYIQNNVKSMALFKPYAESLPDFLHNRPHTFIQHCLKRLTNAPLHTIEETPQGLCVKSGDSDEIYELQMRLQTPKCTCEDYKSSHWPCKHMLAVIVSMPEYRWDSLPKTYTSLPCFVLDMGLICDEAPTEDGSTQEQQEPSPPEGSEDDLCDENLFKVSLGLLKNVETGLYGPVSSETLRLAVIKLKELDALLSEQAPKQAGIPIRKRRTPYKTAKPYQPEKKSKKFDVKSISIYTVFLESKLEDVNEKVDDVIHEVRDDFLNNDLNEVINDDPNEQVDLEELDEPDELDELPSLCGSPRLEEHIVKEGTDFQGFDLLSKTQTEDVSIVNPAGYVVCRSKSFTVTDHDLNELVHHRTYMNNEVLGMYLQIIIQDSSREDGFIDSLVMQSALRQKKLPSRFNNIQTLERVFCCVHENGSHWVLLVIYPKERKTLYLNSLGEGKLMLDSYKAATRAMMRSIMGNELGIGRWKCVTLPHSKQTDSVSCGLFVCRFVELLLQNEQPKLEVSQYDLADQRMRIAERLIEETDNKMLDEICTYCGHMYDAGDDNTPVEWRDCDGCGRWFHIACLNLAVHSPQPYMNAWLCSHCLNNKIAKEMADEGIIMIQSSQEKAKGTREDEEPC
ncbi:hypothetical protein ScPMuIL_008140 [Solemya velum]